MTAVATATRTRPVGRPRAAYTGLPTMIGLVLRRNRWRLLIWTLVLPLMTALVIESQRAAFPTQADRDAYAAIANTPAIAALTGLPYAAGTLGGILIIKIWMTNAMIMAFVVGFLVTRNGRAEEEAGRTELLRAGVLGQHAGSVANYLVATAFAVVTGIATALAAIAMGLPAEGSFAMGASYAGVGIAVLGIAALIGQLSGTSRTANALTATVIGIAYLIRAGADVNATDETPAWYSWLSPIGWGQQVRAYGENRWWPLLISVGVGIALCVAAILIEERRDLGSSLLPERRGARQASRSLRSGLGLSLRLQRGPIIGWTIASVLSAAFYGAIVQAMLGVLSPDSDYAKAFIGDSANIVDALLGLLLVFAALMVGAFAVQSALVLHTEEADGQTETLWSGARSRVSWLLSRLALPVLGSAVLLALTGAAMGASFGTSVDDPAQAGALALAALNYWPSVLLTVGIVALAAAFVPRAATAIGWGVLSLSVLVSLFGELLSLPDWITGNTPFTAVARMPAEAFDPGSFLVISALGLVALVAALLRYRSRDMRSL